jgi:hypothetical protein
MRRFVLQNLTDEIVAEGVEFTDGTAVIHWDSSEYNSTVICPNMMEVEAVHGKGGEARIMYHD